MSDRIKRHPYVNGATQCQDQTNTTITANITGENMFHVLDTTGHVANQKFQKA